MNRSEVYAAIDSERDYQDRKWGTTEQRPKQVGSWLTLLRVILTDAEREWHGASGDEQALHELRKLAATATACLEQHGVPSRFTEPPKPIVDWSVEKLEHGS